MKKFFYIFVSLISLTTIASAQTTEQTNQFVINAFPTYMPGVVINETETVIVSERIAKKLAKKNDTESYQYTNLQGKMYVAQVRIGDTLYVFNGQPYYSKGQSAFMLPLGGQAKAPKQKRAPRTAEQKAQDQQMVSKGISILTNVVLPTVLKKNNVSYAGSNWAGASLPTGNQ